MLLRGVNDSREDLAALEEFLDGLDAGVNLLSFNSFEGAPFAPSPFGTFAVWTHLLKRHGFTAQIIEPRGSDIAGACGQLANKVAGE